MRTDWPERVTDETHDTYRDVSVVRQTDKALLCLFPEFGGDKNVEKWVPKSQIHADSEVYTLGQGECGKLVVNGWWSIKALEEHAKLRSERKAGALARAAAAGRARAQGGG